MAIVGSPLSFELLVDGAPYGGSTGSAPWADANVMLYTYQPTITAGVVTAGFQAYTASGVLMSTPVTDTDGAGYFDDTPAGHYCLILNLADGNGWRKFARYRSVWHGVAEPAYLRIDGDGTAGPWNLDLSGGDGINTSLKPYQNDIDVRWNGRTLMIPTTDYTLALATEYPWDNSDAAHTNTLTLVRTPGGSAVLKVGEYLDITIRYLPGGGY